MQARSIVTCHPGMAGIYLGGGSAWRQEKPCFGFPFWKDLLGFEARDACFQFWPNQARAVFHRCIRAFEPQAWTCSRSVRT